MMTRIGCPRNYGQGLGLALALALAACSQVPPSGSTSGSSQAQAKPPSASGSAAGQAQAKPGPAGWDQIVANAKREGVVVVYGQTGSGVNEAMTAGFKQQYPDIRIEFNGANGSELETKIITERQAGRFEVDLMLHGPPNLVHLVPESVFDAIQPSLVGPDSDPANWLGGKLEFSDNAGKYVLLLLAGVAAPAIYNPTVMSAADLASYRDLLNPKWKNKLAMLDPRIPGNAQGLAQFWTITPSLGRDFVKQLFDQSVTFTRDDRQLTDWVARAQFPIALGANGLEAIQLRQQGVAIEFVNPEQVKENSYLTASWGSLGMVNRAAHPNAAKVYLNWVLSKTGQEAMVKASGYASRRQDASTAGLIPATIPKPGIQYVEITKETYVNQRPELVEYLKTLIGS